jgi:predicted DNA binding CopG/RHH family protein
MRRVKLTAQESQIEGSLARGEFVDISRPELDQIVQSIAARKKDTVLNLRVNSQDLNNIKTKAKKMGIKYQTFIAELLHRVAHY